MTRLRHHKSCQSQLVQDGGSYTAIDYCCAPKGHSGPCFSTWSQKAWFIDFGEVTYFGRSAIRVMEGGSWLPSEHLPSDPDAPPLKVTVSDGAES